MEKDHIHTLLNGFSFLDDKDHRESFFYISFIVITLSVFLAFGVLAVSSLLQAHSISKKLSQEQIPLTEQLHSLQETLSRERYVAKRLSNFEKGAGASFNDLSSRVYDHQRNFEKSLGSIRTLTHGRIAENQLSAIEEQYRDYKKTMELFMSGIEIRTSGTPAPTTNELFKESDFHADKLVDSIFELSKAVTFTLNESGTLLAETHKLVERNLLLLLAVFFVSLCGFGIFVFRRGNPFLISHVSEAEGEISRLHTELNDKNKLLTEKEVVAVATKTEEQIKHIENLKSEFVSIVAHQLRTPLAGIKWTLDMLINGDLGVLNPDQKTFLFKIHDGNERMIRFVNDLLSINRIESGRLQYNFTSLNLQHVAESVLLDIYPIANKKGIAINFRGKGVTLPQVAADPEKIRVAFQNLLENAVKYTERDGHITLELRNRGAEVLVMVSDNGFGIPKDEQSGIFKRFYRAPSAVKMQTEGSGLGLYLARAIVEAHGGRIWFESIPGEGTSFYFTIPVPRKSD